jgi:hypothetical protein
MTTTIEITAQERGLLLRMIEYSMEKQNELPFCDSLPSDYWLANGLREKLYGINYYANSHEQPNI